MSLTNGVQTLWCAIRRELHVLKLFEYHPPHYVFLIFWFSHCIKPFCMSLFFDWYLAVPFHLLWAEQNWSQEVTKDGHPPLTKHSLDLFLFFLDLFCGIVWCWVPSIFHFVAQPWILIWKAMSCKLKMAQLCCWAAGFCHKEKLFKKYDCNCATCKLNKTASYFIQLNHQCKKIRPLKWLM